MSDIIRGSGVTERHSRPARPHPDPPPSVHGSNIVTKTNEDFPHQKYHEISTVEHNIQIRVWGSVGLLPLIVVLKLNMPWILERLNPKCLLNTISQLEPSVDMCESSAFALLSL